MNSELQILNYIVEPILLLSERLKFIYCNQAFEDLFSLPRVRLQDESLASIFTNHDGLIEACLKTIKDEESTYYELAIHERILHVCISPTPFGAFLLFEDAAERKRGEKTFHEIDEKYHNLIETSPDLIWSVNLEGRVTFVNQAALRVYGYEPHELIGHFYSDFFSPEQLQKNKPLNIEVLANGSRVKEYVNRFLRKDGTTVILSSNAEYLRDESGNIIGLTGTARDITERNQAEEALKAAQGRNESVLDSVTDVHILFDRHWHYLYLNKAAARAIGRSREQILGHTLWELFPDIVGTELDDQYHLAMDESIPAAFDFYYPTTDTWWENRFYPAPEGLAVFGTNITERKKAAGALKKQKEILQKIFDHLPLMISFSDENGNIKLVNQEWERTLGWTLEEIKKQNLDIFSEFYPDPQYRKKVMDFITAANGEWAEFKTRVRDSQIIDTVWSRIRLSDGTSFGIGQNITARKQAEEDLRRQANRTELLSDISQAFANVGLNYEQVLKILAQRTAEIIGDACVITLFSDDGKRSFPVAFHHTDPKALTLMHNALLVSWQGGTDTESYRALQAGESIYIPVVSPEQIRESLEPEFLPYLDQVGISSMLIVPLQAQGSVIGTLGITRDQQGHEYTFDDRMLLQQLAARAALAIQNAKLYEQVRGGQEQLRRLTGYLQTAQEKERTHLAREIHDELGQSLTALKMDLAWLAKRLPKDQPALKEKAAIMSDLIDETVVQVRQIATELRPGLLDNLGLAAAIEWQAQEFSRRTGIVCELELEECNPTPDGEQATQLFRIAQEALTNIARHSGATKVKIKLITEPQTLLLSIEDNGRGIKKSEIANTESLGLIGMRERAYAFGGEFNIQGFKGKGTRLEVSIPRQISVIH